MFKHEALIELGSKVRDVVTGVEGIVTSVCFHMTGCTRYWLETKVHKETGKGNDHWIDEARAQVLGSISPSPSDCGPPNSSPRP